MGNSSAANISICLVKCDRMQCFLKPLWFSKGRVHLIWDSSLFLVFRFPNVVGAGLQTLSLQCFPLSHFSFLFKYSLHSSCSSWSHSFPTAGIKYEANAWIENSQTLGVLALNSHFLLSTHYKKNTQTHLPISVEHLESKLCRSVSVFLQTFGKMTKMEVKTTWP